MEGVSGIVDGSIVSRKHGDYERGRKLIAADATASIPASLVLNRFPDETAAAKGAVA